MNDLRTELLLGIIRAILASAHDMVKVKELCEDALRRFG